MLEEIRDSFKTTSEKEISLDMEKDQGKNSVQRSPEIIYGLRNFIGNSVKFSKKNIIIRVDSDTANVNVIIEDDGPGFPEDVIQILGEPYIRSKSQEISSKTGTGLGKFLVKSFREKRS